MSADANDGLSRRGFLAISAATLGGVMLAPAEAVVRVCAHGFAPLASFGLEAWQPKQSSLTLA